MKHAEYIHTPAGIRRVRAIAKRINKSQGVTMRQCMEIARDEVSRWAFVFSLGGLRNDTKAHASAVICSRPE